MSNVAVVVVGGLERGGHVKNDLADGNVDCEYNSHPPGGHRFIDRALQLRPDNNILII